MKDMFEAMLGKTHESQENPQFVNGDEVINEYGEKRTVLRQDGVQVFVIEESNAWYLSSKLTKLNESPDQFKSDEDIAKEFDNFKILKIDVKPSGNSGMIEIDFPNGQEHVGGGTNLVTDSWIKYEHNGKIAFDNWYPENVYLQLVSAINDKLNPLSNKEGVVESKLNEAPDTEMKSDDELAKEKDINSPEGDMNEPSGIPGGDKTGKEPEEPVIDPKDVKDIPASGQEKEAFGSKGTEDFFTLVTFYTPDGKVDNYQVLDGTDATVWDAKENEIDVSDIKAVVREASVKLGITQVDFNIVDKHLMPEPEVEEKEDNTEEIEKETEQTQDTSTKQVNQEQAAPDTNESVVEEGYAENQQKKIAIDTLRHPDKSILSGPTVAEAEKTLKEKFGYTDEQIKKLKESKIKEYKCNNCHKEEAEQKGLCSKCLKIKQKQEESKLSKNKMITTLKEAKVNEEIPAPTKNNGYVCFYKGKRFEVYADTSYEAQQKCAKENGIKKAYDINVVLAEKGGKQVTHVATESKGNFTTGAQRYNKKMDSIWAKAKADGAFSDENLAMAKEHEEVKETKIQLFADGKYLSTTTKYKTVKDAVASVQGKDELEVAGRNLTGKENPANTKGKKITGRIINEEVTPEEAQFGVNFQRFRNSASRELKNTFKILEDNNYHTVNSYMIAIFLNALEKGASPKQAEIAAKEYLNTQEGLPTKMFNDSIKKDDNMKETVREDVNDMEAPVGEETPVTAEEHSALDCIHNVVKFDTLTVEELQELVDFLTDLKTEKESEVEGTEDTEELPETDVIEPTVAEGKVPVNPNEVDTKDGKYQQQLTESDKIFHIDLSEARSTNEFQALLSETRKVIGS